MNRDIAKVARELCEETGESVAVWHDVQAFVSGSFNENFRIYICGKMDESGTNLDDVVNALRARLAPEVVSAEMLRKAEELEAQATKLRAAAGGAA